MNQHSAASEILNVDRPQDQYRGIGQEGARDRNPLTLSPRQFHTALADRRAIALPPLTASIMVPA